MTVWYVVWRPAYGRIAGFITEEDGETPAAWDSEEDAEEAMKGNILESASEIIEL